MRARWLAVAALSVAAVASACGGGKPEAPTASATKDVADALPFAATTSTVRPLELSTTTIASTTTTTTTSAPSPPSTAAPQPFAPAPTTVYYANCDDARAHGAAPLHANDPGYQSALDRDHDGIACE